jgi:dsDNA-specific endonuclease/ATPase MutS2
MKFEIGDKVKFLNDSIEGEISGFTPTGRFIVKCGNGFEHETIQKNLVLSIDFSDEVIVTVVDIAEKCLSYKKHKENKQVAKRNRGGLYREVDLHIEDLLESHRGMTNTELFNYQMSVFKRELDKAIINHERKVIFIHGVGEGILRDEIRNTIRLEYSEVNFYDASYKEYGFGATEVLIHN